MNKSTRFIEKETNDGLMLYDSQKDDVHILNHTANTIYKLYKEGKTEAEIEKSLIEDFQCSDDQNIKEDIRGIIDKLKDKEII